MKPGRHRLARVLFGRLNHIDEWRLGDPARAEALGYPREYALPDVDDSGILFFDVVLEAGSHRPRCHEVNGANAAGSDALTGESTGRASNEVRQVLRLLADEQLHTPDGTLGEPVVTIHAHQHWSAFRTGYEFYTRVEDFTALLEDALPEHTVAVSDPAAPLPDADVTVLVGDVPSCAGPVRFNPARGRFEVGGRRVVFMGNPNLRPELSRLGRVETIPAGAWRVFHGARFLPLVHDKARQQELFAGTSVVPLESFEANGVDAALDALDGRLDRGPWVVKPNGTSGGCGVHVVTGTMNTAQRRRRVQAVLDDAVQKYGPGSEPGLLPLRGFPFVRSTPFPAVDGGRLWDLRIAVEYEPGRACLYPVSFRFTPRAFDARGFHDDRDQWITNVGGREETLLRSGLDSEVLAAVGLSEERTARIHAACIQWISNAWASVAAAT